MKKLLEIINIILEYVKWSGLCDWRYIENTFLINNKLFIIKVIILLIKIRFSHYAPRSKNTYFLGVPVIGLPLPPEPEYGTSPPTTSGTGVTVFSQSVTMTATKWTPDYMRGGPVNPDTIILVPNKATVWILLFAAIIVLLLSVAALAYFCWVLPKRWFLLKFLCKTFSFKHYIKYLISSDLSKFI